MSSYIATSSNEAREISTNNQVINEASGLSSEDLNLTISPNIPVDRSKDWAKADYDTTKNIYFGNFPNNPNKQDYYFNLSTTNTSQTPLFNKSDSKINIYGNATRGYKSNQIINIYKSGYQDYYKLIMGSIYELTNTSSINYSFNYCVVGCPVIIAVCARESESATSLNYTVTNGWTLLSKSPYGLYQFEGDASFHTQIFVFTKIAQSKSESFTFTNTSGWKARILAQGFALKENISFTFNQKDGVDYWSEETVADNAHALVLNDKPTIWICSNSRWIKDDSTKWSSEGVKYPVQNTAQPRFCLGVSNSLTVGEDHIFNGHSEASGYKIIGSIAFDTDWLWKTGNVWINRLDYTDMILEGYNGN